MAALAWPASWALRREALPSSRGGARGALSHDTGLLTPWRIQRRHGSLPHRRAAAVAAAAAAPPEQAQDPAPAAPPLVPAAALPGGQHRLAEDVEVDVTGTARHLGLGMEWQLSFAAAGSFVEHLSSPHLSCSCGYDAAAREDGLVAGQRCSGGGGASSSSITTSSSSNDSGGCGSSITTSSSSAPGGAPAYFQPAGVCWSSDDGGCPRLLQLDDAEAQLLCMWVRTGLWVLPNISSQLKIARASAKEAAACAAAASTSTSSSLREDEEASCSSSGSSGAASEQLGPSVWLKLKLRGGGKLTALVEVLESDWRPLSLRLCLAGEHEVWRFSDWHQWQPGLWLAGGAVQSTTGEGGVVNDYSLAAVQVSSVGSSGAAGSGSTDGGSGTNSSSSRRFVQPPAPLLPPCSSFVPGLPEEVPAWHTSSGHSLVRPLLNGRDVGYFILDTGASGFVLDPSTGDALGLEAFGELQVTSIVGRIASRYRRADTFQLGPLRMARPLLMELPMAGLVTGVPDGGRVVGIVGYDVLRRAVVHVPAPPRRPPPPAAVASARVDSPAAAFAASVTAAQLRRGALPFTLRFQHPEALEQGSSSSSSSKGSSSSSSSKGSSSSSQVASEGSSTACPMAVGPASTAAAAAAAAVGSPEAEAGGGASSSSSSPSHQPASCLLTGQGVEAALAAELAVAAVGPTAGAADAAAVAAAVEAAAAAASRAGGVPVDGPVGEDEWMPVVMVASLPHIALELVTAEGRRHRGLFMVDSGAGGLDIVLNARAAQALGLGKGSTATHIKGLGGGGGARMTAQRCQLGEVWLGPHCFTSVQALYREGPGGNGGLELSQHTSGIVCGGVLGRCTLVFDYPRLRLAVRRPAAPEAAAVAAAAG